ncbi:MAG: heme NO-binding domain-containing protein [Nannocystaceae bacterium]
MYGLVNHAVEGLVRRDFGAATWEQIKADADIDIEQFISSENYDDSVTYALIASASKILDLDPQTILIAFGRYWVLTTARESYGELLMATGRTLPEFLPNLHSRVILLYTRLRPPTFRVSRISESTIHVFYQSHRKGLDDFVVGLLEGLGELFEIQCAVQKLATRGNEHSASLFEVKWSPDA